MNRPESAPGVLDRTLWSLVYLLAAAFVALAALRATTGLERIAGTTALVRRTAHRPYVYRQLVPSLIRAAASLAPERWARFEDRVASPAFRERFERLSASRYRWWREEDPGCVLLGAAIHMLCLLLFAHALRALLRSQLVGPRRFFDLTPLVALLLLRYLAAEGVYAYDYAQVFLFTLGLVLLATERWAWFCLVYAVALLNKETSVLLAVAFAAHGFRRMPTRRYVAHAASLGLLFVAVKGGLDRAFRDNPGQVVETHLLDHNLAVLLDRPDLAHLAAWALLLGLVFHGWRDKPVFLRRASWLGLPLALLTLLFGWIDELRDFYELYPIAVGLVGPSVARLVLGWPVQPAAAAPAGLTRLEADSKLGPGESAVPDREERELRKFGLVVGSGFVLLALVSRWRGHVVPPRVLGALGLVLVATGLLAPRGLRPVERVWMRFAEALGWVNTRVLLGVLFYLVMTPVGLVMRLFRDPMDRRLDDGRTSEWIPREAGAADPARYRRPF